MSHLRTSGVRRARRLPTVMQRKLATCQGTKGRICFVSQRSSPGTLGRRTTSRFVNQHRRDTLELKHRHSRSQASSESVRRSLFGQFLVGSVGSKGTSGGTPCSVSFAKQTGLLPRGKNSQRHTWQDLRYGGKSRWELLLHLPTLTIEIASDHVSHKCLFKANFGNPRTPYRNNEDL